MKLNITKRWVALAIVLATMMVGCSVAPSTSIKAPLTAKPELRKAPNISSGAIYAASNHRPLYEDRRARFVGDILTINIVENTLAVKAGVKKSSKTGSVDTTVAKPTGLPFTINAIGVSADSDIQNEEKDDATASNRFTGAIAVTVVEVLENGNLMVSGEKQIAFDRGSEFVRFYGVVNPDTIGIGNVVPSTKVADAKIEYRTNSQLDAAQVLSILARFFLSFAPI